MLLRRLLVTSGNASPLLKGWTCLVSVNFAYYCSYLSFQLSLKLTSGDCVLGVKLSDASKKLGKKFATGASVVKVCIFVWALPFC